jgi:hypothetical protein
MEQKDLTWDSPPQELEKLVSRLFHITGFVTTLHEKSDCRALAFSRYYHVRRVAWLSHYIAQKRAENAVLLDFEYINWLAWSHDLNRWPFAHNSEVGLYDQANNILSYFKNHNINVNKKTIVELQNIIKKSHKLLSEEGRIVLLADIVAGYIEDPLWMITALDLKPEIVPDSIAGYLTMPVNDEQFNKKLLSLNVSFYESKQVEPFMREFDLIFREVCESFLEKERIKEKIPLGTKDFMRQHILVKEKFMHERLFSFNTLNISKGNILKTEIVLPYLKYKKESARPDLTEIDENQLMDLAVQLKILDPGSLLRYYPVIDYVMNNEPLNSYRLNSRGGYG